LFALIFFVGRCQFLSYLYFVFPAEFILGQRQALSWIVEPCLVDYGGQFLTPSPQSHCLQPAQQKAQGYLDVHSERPVDVP